MADYARGKKLRGLREGQRLSQEDAAYEIGVSVKSLRSWEKGGGIKWKNAKAAAALYKVDPESLVNRELIEPSDLGPDQLNRIEQKLDRVLGWMEMRTAEEAEADLAPGEDRGPQRDEETGD